MGGATFLVGDKKRHREPRRAELRRFEAGWHLAMRKGKREALNDSVDDRMRERTGQLEAKIRARGGHAFPFSRRQFAQVKTRYRGLKRNAHLLTTSFALTSLYMSRERLPVWEGTIAPTLGREPRIEPALTVGSGVNGAEYAKLTRLHGFRRCLIF